MSFYYRSFSRAAVTKSPIYIDAHMKHKQMARISFKTTTTTHSRQDTSITDLLSQTRRQLSQTNYEIETPRDIIPTLTLSL